MGPKKKATAIKSLNANPHRWHCLPCWTDAAGLSLADLPELDVLARAILAKSGGYEVREPDEQCQCERKSRRCDARQVTPLSVSGVLVRATPDQR